MHNSNVTIIGSWGTFTVNANGERADPSQKDSYPEVARVDLPEYRATYPDCTLDTLDICDVGYWDAAGSYEPPSADYRDEVKKAARVTVCRDS